MPSVRSQVTDEVQFPRHTLFMDFFELIQQRQSIRKWQARPVEQQKMNCILEAINRAPSAGNFQSYEVYRITTEERRKAIASVTWDQGWIVNAPEMLVFCSHPARCQYGPEPYPLEDTTIACTFAMLAVTAVGLGAVWIGAFDPNKVAQVMSLPDGQIPVAILPIGYADEVPERTTRRELRELVHELK
ncbi:MAG TPA: nitroreductase family protein [Terriglobales bacterium]|nr:nitroreductase family protein [Terriglobales bacterium]